MEYTDKRERKKQRVKRGSLQVTKKVTLVVFSHSAKSGKASALRRESQWCKKRTAVHIGCW